MESIVWKPIDLKLLANYLLSLEREPSVLLSSAKIRISSEVNLFSNQDTNFPAHNSTVLSRGFWWRALIWLLGPGDLSALSLSWSFCGQLQGLTQSINKYGVSISDKRYLCYASSSMTSRHTTLAWEQDPSDTPHENMNMFQQSMSKIAS